MDKVKREGKLTKNQRIKAGLFKNKRKPKKTEDEGQEVKRLKKALEKNEIPEASAIKKFMDLPLSRNTLYGLKEAGYTKPTEIQRESLGLALRGLDILGAAKTGSGKTLAFIIPVLERLYLNLWTNMDGVGALIITPTRELAYQIFETLKKVGKKHDFSAGLIIGGKDLKFERKRVEALNIIICTPGRLLQHMDENPSFDCSSLQILVLDEADRCLDMGFQKDMNAILENLPKERRQTLLFSATQTKSVKDLARLSLRSPVFVSVHENAEYSTPTALQQSYIVVPLEEKLEVLWSFIKHHKRSKILVFLSSCKQVRFVHLLFCRSRPGTSILALYGSLHQLKRMSVYDEFCRKEGAVLFATDIAARGLDFPSVDWVLQLDCPEDPTTYLHRVGRTARYNSGGEALLFLLPSEIPIVEGLRRRKIPIQRIEVNEKRRVSVRRKFEALCARDSGLKECAQRAFKSYLKSVWLMKDKSVFDVTRLDLDAFAGSLGLAVAPRVRFLQKKGLGVVERDEGVGLEAKSESDQEIEGDVVGGEVPGFEKKKRDVRRTLDFSVPEESDEDVGALFKGRKPAELDDSESDTAVPLEQEPTTSSSSKKKKTKASLAKKLLKKNILSNKKLLFDEEGGALPDIRKERQSDRAKTYDNEDVGGIDIERAKDILKEEDQYDKQIFRERIRAKHREERLKKRAANAKKGACKEEVGVSFEGDEGDDDEPDLSWLPDPDKIYGKAEEDNPSSSSDSETGERKRPFQVVNSDSESYSDNDEDDDAAAAPAVNGKKRRRVDLDGEMMEDLALKLLSN